jgi:hypothetical protein
MSTSSGPPESWIGSFCSLLGHEYFAEVTEEFIEDEFNLTGLQSQVDLYKEALEVRHVFFLRINGEGAGMCKISYHVLTLFEHR